LGITGTIKLSTFGMKRDRDILASGVANQGEISEFDALMDRYSSDLGRIVEG
jgi:polyisoprenoid-binding protein YceI